MNNIGASHENIPKCRTDIIYLELGCYDCRSQSKSSSKCKRIVRGIRNNTAMNKAILLFDLIFNWDSKLDSITRKLSQLRPKKLAERLRLQNLFGDFQGDM